MKIIRRGAGKLGKPRRGIRALAIMAMFAATAMTLPAQTFTTLYSFCASTSECTGGEYPWGGLIQATDGNLYGTTGNGGTNMTDCSPYGCGTVFKITPSGKLTTLYSFCSQSGCTDGKYPLAALIQATNGDFYGTTKEGGSGGGGGTVFKITASGTRTTLYSFCSINSPVVCTDGLYPSASLIQVSNGDFYGTTFSGGESGKGTVFKITPSGELTTLHYFNDGDSGGGPQGLIQASDGDLYGVTEDGGNIGVGTVFKITLTGALTTLYSFCSQGLHDCADGREPQAALVQGANGNLYGATVTGGAYGCGTIFEITSGGALTTLYSFNGTNGQGIYGGLIQGTDGNFYGTSEGGGADSFYGTVFKITPGGTLTTLYNFCSQGGCADGANSYAGLYQDTSGKFYGVTEDGGASEVCFNSDSLVQGCGTIFSLSVGLRPFVRPQTTSGKVGATVKILGTDLTGASNVTFNGTSTTFGVVSPSLITATVPAGATSGKIQVVTPSGALSSNVRFMVLP